VTNGLRSEILGRRFRALRGVTTRLCQTLTPEDCALQSMPDASPTKWHLAHTTWFFETFVLRRVDPGYRIFHPRFEYLFNSYYDSVGAQYPRDRRGMLSRPTLEEIGRYRAHVDTATGAMLEDPGRLDDATLDVIELGLHHEQQHQELLLTDVKHLLFQNPLAPAYRITKEPEPRAIRSLAWCAYDEGVCRLGHQGSGFAFDNESPRHRVFLDAFEIASRPIRNGEYAAFIEDGGYERPELWLAEGFARVREEGWRAPLYWVRAQDRWQSFTLSGLRSLRMEEPVCHVSFYEADAFARWAGCRLPREAEWERTAADVAVEGHFLESGSFHPQATVAPPSTPGEVALGAAAPNTPLQLFGDVWEWTASPYVAYPGFAPTAGALGEYNGKFMANQIVLRGGSCVSPRSHLRASYRNFFHPHARWQFSGIRLARDR